MLALFAPPDAAAAKLRKGGVSAAIQKIYEEVKILMQMLVPAAHISCTAIRQHRDAGKT